MTPAHFRRGPPSRPPPWTGGRSQKEGEPPPFLSSPLSRGRSEDGLSSAIALRRNLDGLPVAGDPARVIGSIRHKALRDYWTTGRTKGLNAGWIRKLRRILAVLEAADGPERMNYPGSYFHPLKGDRRGRYSVRLTANVRVTFGWNDDGAADVDIEDYHR